MSHFLLDMSRAPGRGGAAGPGTYEPGGLGLKPSPGGQSAPGASPGASASESVRTRFLRLFFSFLAFFRIFLAFLLASFLICFSSAFLAARLSALPSRLVTASSSGLAGLPKLWALRAYGREREYDANSSRRKAPADTAHMARSSSICDLRGSSPRASSRAHEGPHLRRREKA